MGVQFARTLDTSRDPNCQSITRVSAKIFWSVGEVFAAMLEYVSDLCSTFFVKETLVMDGLVGLREGLRINVLTS